MAPILKDHVISVEWVRNNHGYPWRAVCSCGEWSSRTYAAQHAAEAMGAEHVEREAGLR